MFRKQRKENDKVKSSKHPYHISDIALSVQRDMISKMLNVQNHINNYHYLFLFKFLASFVQPKLELRLRHRVWHSKAASNFG